MAAVPLPVVRSSQRGSVAKEVIEIAEADVVFMLRHIATTEIAGQIQIGNPPTHMLIDGKAGTNIQAARYSVRAFFTNRRLMLSALKEAWNILMGPARVKTGYSKSHFQVWVNGRSVGNQPNAVTEEMLTPDSVVRIVGPTVAHTRKYQWMVGGKQFTRTNRKTMATTGLSLYQGVVRQVKRAYRSLKISEGWVDVPNLNTKGRTSVTRIPGLRIGTQKRGRLKG